MSTQLCSKVFALNPSEEESMSTRCIGEGGIITYKRTSHSSGFVDIESFEAKYGVESAKESSIWVSQYFRDFLLDEWMWEETIPYPSLSSKDKVTDAWNCAKLQSNKIKVNQVISSP